MYMQSDVIRVRVADGVGTIIINRPDARNCLTQPMLGYLSEALDDLYYEKRVRAIVLTGAGDDFSCGIDLEEMQDDDPSDLPPQQWGDEAIEYRDLLLKMLELTKPIIAAVNGAALCEGAGLALASDIVVASEDATFGLPDARRGLVAGVVAPLLCFRIGAGMATRMLISSAPIDAAEAHRVGVFHELVEPDQVWARAAELGQECAAGAPEAIQLTKRLLFETVGEQLATQLTAGAAMAATARTTEAAREGIAAFLAQRSPEWK